MFVSMSVVYRPGISPERVMATRRGSVTWFNVIYHAWVVPLRRVTVPISGDMAIIVSDTLRLGPEAVVCYGVGGGLYVVRVLRRGGLKGVR